MITIKLFKKYCHGTAFALRGEGRIIVVPDASSSNS